MKKLVVMISIVALVFMGVSSGAYAHSGGGHSGGGHSGGGGHYGGGHSGYSGSTHAGVTSGRSSGGSYRGGRAYGGGRGYSGTGSRGYNRGYVGGHYYGGHYYRGGYYGGHHRYYYTRYAPYGAAFGFFFGEVVVGGIFNPFWWPYYYVPVSPAYYDPYYSFPYPAPSYVIEVPPAEATTAYQGTPATTATPNQCYAPKVDARGNIVKENDNMVPDFSKPVPCPTQ